MKTLFGFCLMLFSLLAHSQKLTQETFDGTVGSIPVSIVMTYDGQAAFGTVTYKKKGIPIASAGSYDGGTLFITELLPDGTVSGSYSGEIKGSSVVGSWYGGPPKNKELALNLKKVKSTTIVRKPLGNLTGTYHYNFGKDAGSGDLTVKQIAKDKITVNFECTRGGPSYNMATIDKITLKLNDNEAIYANKEYGNCKLSIKFCDNLVRVDYLDEGYECGFGHNATVAGSYIKK